MGDRRSLSTDIGKSESIGHAGPRRYYRRGSRAGERARAKRFFTPFYLGLFVVGIMIAARRVPYGPRGDRSSAPYVGPRSRVTGRGTERTSSLQPPPPDPPSTPCAKHRNYLKFPPTLPSPAEPGEQLALGGNWTFFNTFDCAVRSEIGR